MTKETAMSFDPLRHWSVLQETEAKYVKDFKRPGGFEGSSVNPTYRIMQMTKHFGPCGLGWGYLQPVFTTHQIGDTLLVFCEIALWYTDKQTGAKSELIYGRGGDVVSGKNKYGIYTDDESYKKAQTDALGNAMKMVGVSADVHLGLYDDDKYVAEKHRQAERAPEPQRDKPRENGKQVFEVGTIDGHILVEADRPRDWCKAILAELKETKADARLQFWKVNEATLRRVEEFVAGIRNARDREPAEKFLDGFKRDVLNLLPAANGTPLVSPKRMETDHQL